MRYRYVNRLTRDDVGQRVVIRRWVADDERGLVPSDVLGQLEAWHEDGRMFVRDRHGAVVEVHEDDVLAAKTVPPPRPRRGR